MNTLHDSPNRRVATRHLAAATGAGSLALMLVGCGSDTSDSIEKFNDNYPTTEITLPSTTQLETLTQFVDEYCGNELDDQETRDAVYLIEVTNGKSTALIQPAAEFDVPVKLCEIAKTN